MIYDVIFNRALQMVRMLIKQYIFRRTLSCLERDIAKFCLFLIVLLAASQNEYLSAYHFTQKNVLCITFR